LYNNYLATINNEGTFQYYLVAKIKNLNTGKVREYCTQGNFLKAALHHEYNLGYDEKGISKVYSLAANNTDRYFEFKNDSAIWNIGGVWKYSMNDLANLERKIDFDSIVTQIIRDKKWSKRIPDERTILLYAHALFNRGILTGQNNCFGGTLVYINKNSR
jgi:hypothetical protein